MYKKYLTSRRVGGKCYRVLRFWIVDQPSKIVSIVVLSLPRCTTASTSSAGCCQMVELLQRRKEQPRQGEIGGCNLDAKPSVLHQVASIHRNGR